MNKYLKLGNYLNTVSKIINRHLLSVLDYGIAPSPRVPLKHPPIFIVGAPRSGSTLLTQVLTDAFNLGYLCNRHCQFFGAPALADRMFSPLRKKKPSDYRSRDGATTEAYAPNECADWWYRFFRRQPAYVPLEEADVGKMRRMRRSVAALTNALDRPVLFKNLYATLRLIPIIEYFPEALFILIERNELDNAHSLLEGRRRLHGSYDDWWSVEPPDIASLRSLPAHIQVVEQIRHIRTLIDKNIMESGIDSGRIHRVTYEELCVNTHQFLESCGHFLFTHGINANRLFAVPESFERQTDVRIDQSTYVALVDYVNQRA